MDPDSHSRLGFPLTHDQLEARIFSREALLFPIDDLAAVTTPAGAPELLFLRILDS